MQENDEIKYLKLEDIIPNRLQPRTEFNEEKLNELANSIKQYGIINPLIVRAVGNKYEIIAGERRYKASKIAGLTQVPVIISNMDDSTSAEVAIIENIQRQDLTALEEARSYRKLLDQGSITQEQLAQKMGKTQSTIANKMRLLHLCDEVQEALENNQISERHARSLLQLKDINDQREMLEKIVKERMTVKMTENAIKEKLQTNSSNSQNEIIENNIVSTPNLNENIYGNDIVSIMDLNKKELEKENDNMNNEQNIQMNQGMFTTPSMPENPTPAPQQAPAFGDRFFPSLEDQETNLNLTNPFEIPSPAPSSNLTAQPMMENLVDTNPLPQSNAIPTPQPMPNIEPTSIPSQPEPAINIPSFVTNNQTIPSMPNFMDNTNMPIESNLQPTNLPNNFEETNPINLGNGLTPSNNIVAEPIINPIVQPTPASPTPMPNIEPPVEPIIPPTQSPQIETPIVSTSPIIESQKEVTTPMPTIEIAAQNDKQEETIPTLDNKSTDNIINAINALKNLGLSIQSIGYKATISEEDTPTTYKIVIELEK